MKSLLFDVYGTIVDISTNENNKDFWIKLSKKAKRYKSYNYKELRNNYMKLCEKYSQSYEEIDIINVFMDLFSIEFEEANNFAKVFRRLSRKYYCCYKGVNRCLNELKKLGYKLYILSNAQSAFTLPELRKLKLLQYFDGIAISSDFGVKKPNKEFFIRTINKFNIDGEIWMIGNDYECDILPAKELGLNTIFIESNLTPKNNISDKLIGFKPDEIVRIINKNN